MSQKKLKERTLLEKLDHCHVRKKSPRCKGIKTAGALGKKKRQVKKGDSAAGMAENNKGMGSKFLRGRNTEN